MTEDDRYADLFHGKTMAYVFLDPINPFTNGLCIQVYQPCLPQYQHFLNQDLTDITIFLTISTLEGGVPRRPVSVIAPWVWWL